MKKKILTDAQEAGLNYRKHRAELLKALDELEKLNHKKLGSRGKAYWVTSTGKVKYNKGRMK